VNSTVIVNSGIGNIVNSQANVITGVNVSLGATTGNAGTSSASVFTQAGTVIANTGGNGTVFVDNSAFAQIVNVSGSTAAGSFNFVTGGDIVVNGAITTTTGAVTLQSGTGGVGSISGSVVTAPIVNVVAPDSPATTVTLTLGAPNTVFNIGTVAHPVVN